MGKLPVTFLTDYGTADGFPGICRAVIERESPGTVVIDLSHEVPRHDVRRGAVMLADAVPYLPAGVHLAIVDPGVGGPRREVAVRSAGGRLFVGPDNGLLAPAIERTGGAEAASDLSRSSLRADPVSATFHGRDVFSPVAAALARGAALDEVGDPIDPAALVSTVMPRAMVREGAIAAHALLIDGFGNVALDLRRGEAGFDPDLGDRLEVRSGDHRLSVRAVNTFADAEIGELVLYEDSSGRFALGVREASAAASMEVSLDAEIQLRPDGDDAA